MIAGKRVLTVIPARGGSRGVPRKNLRPVGGKPLIAWCIEAAKQSNFIDRLIVSSEDAEIIATASKWGCEAPFVRPAQLATDSSSTAEVAVHAFETLPDYELGVVLQPTAPLVRAEDIDGCIRKCIDREANACVTIAEVGKSPFWMFSMGDDDELSPLLGLDYLQKRRQELPKCYIPNGALFVVERSWFMDHRSLYDERTVGYVMPRERSMDLDTEMDFIQLETWLKHYITQ